MQFPFTSIGTARWGDIRLILKSVPKLIDGPVRNLVAFSEEGTELWVAENPINLQNSFYSAFMNMDPLKVYNYAGFLCTIDPLTGKVLETKFTK